MNYTYEQPKTDHYTDDHGIEHEVHSYVNEEDTPRKKDYYTDERGVMHSFYYCEHCNKPIVNTHRCGDHIYCSMKCALEVDREEMKTWKPKKVREIRMVHL
jgi:hypothetical protein